MAKVLEEIKFLFTPMENGIQVEEEVKEEDVVRCSVCDSLMEKSVRPVEFYFNGAPFHTEATVYHCHECGFEKLGTCMVKFYENDKTDLTYNKGPFKTKAEINAEKVAAMGQGLEYEEPVRTMAVPDDEEYVETGISKTISNIKDKVKTTLFGPSNINIGSKIANMSSIAKRDLSKIPSPDKALESIKNGAGRLSAKFENNIDLTEDETDDILKNNGHSDMVEKKPEQPKHLEFVPKEPVAKPPVQEEKPKQEPKKEFKAKEPKAEEFKKKPEETPESKHSPISNDAPFNNKTTKKTEDTKSEPKNAPVKEEKVPEIVPDEEAKAIIESRRRLLQGKTASNEPSTSEERSNKPYNGRTNPHLPVSKPQEDEYEEDIVEDDEEATKPSESFTESSEREMEPTQSDSEERPRSISQMETSVTTSEINKIGMFNPSGSKYLINDAWLDNAKERGSVLFGIISRFLSKKHKEERALNAHQVKFRAIIDEILYDTDRSTMFYTQKKTISGGRLCFLHFYKTNSGSFFKIMSILNEPDEIILIKKKEVQQILASDPDTYERIIGHDYAD